MAITLLNSKLVKNITVLLLFSLLLVAGCSQPDISSQPLADTDNSNSAEQKQIISDLTTLTDGILRSLAANKYQWLKYYSETELTGPQIARLLLGDAAFDRNIVSWITSDLEVQLSPDNMFATVSIPVSHEARVDKKFRGRTTIFNFKYYFSKEHNRWLLNFAIEQ